MSDTEIHEGGCVCGGVRYRTTGKPQRVSACACTWCQKRSGAAFGLSRPSDWPSLFNVL